MTSSPGTLEIPTVDTALPTRAAVIGAAHNRCERVCSVKPAADEFES